MASSSENISMAVFCDFENVALGVRDANYEKFDIKPVLERLLLKGSIVVKKSYCDWDRYKSFKGGMHEANFELIEIPHVRQSGKNSADIRLVVDALDLCYTKAHVNTFVIVSGDSDFSPLVSKLRENAKRVIGVGVKNSTSDLLVANCDEFIFYDDLVREQRRAAAKRDERKAQPQSPSQSAPNRRPSDEGNRKREEMETRKLQALEMVVETFDALVAERGDTGKIWASLLKDTLKRRRPDFNETYFGFRTFGNLLEDAQTRGLFEFGRDEKSGTYVYRNPNLQAELQPAELQPSEMLAGVPDPEPSQAVSESAASSGADEVSADAPASDAAASATAAREPRRRGGRGRKGREQADAAAVPTDAPTDAPTELGAETAGEAGQPDAVSVDAGFVPAPTPDLAEAASQPAAPVSAATGSESEPESKPESTPAAEDAASAKERRRSPRAPRKPAARKNAAGIAAADAAAAAPAAQDAAAAAAAAAAVAPKVGTRAETRHAAAEPNAAADAAGDVTVAPGEPGNVAESAEATDGKGAKSARTKSSSRPAHKAPSRKAAPRARRPAKPKTPPENS